MALRLADRLGYLVSAMRLRLPVPVRGEGPFAGVGEPEFGHDAHPGPPTVAAPNQRRLASPQRKAWATRRHFGSAPPSSLHDHPQLRRRTSQDRQSPSPECPLSAARWFRSYGGGVRLRDRHFCATCRHIVAERRGTRDVLFRCGRLGWETKPGWRFSCWQERPAGERMRRVDAAAADDDGNCAGMEGD